MFQNIYHSSNFSTDGVNFNRISHAAGRGINFSEIQLDRSVIFSMNDTVASRTESKDDKFVTVEVNVGSVRNISN